MLISALIILSFLLVLFRILRGESVRDIHREIKELKAQDVPHFFFKSLKIVDRQLFQNWFAPMHADTGAPLPYHRFS